MIPLAASIACFFATFLVKAIICGSETVWLDLGPSLTTWTAGIAYTLSYNAPNKYIGSIASKVTQNSNGYQVELSVIPPNFTKFEKQEEAFVLLLVLVALFTSITLYAWGYVDYKAGSLRMMKIKGLANAAFGLLCYVLVLRYHWNATK